MGQISGGMMMEEEKMRLNKQFLMMDKDGSGELDTEELFAASALRNNPVVKRIIQIFDKNGNGKISISEFTEALTTVLAGSPSQQKITFAFKFYDMDGDGYVSAQDLASVTRMMVGSHLSDDQLSQLVRRTFATSKCADPTRGFTINEFAEVVLALDILNKLSVNFKQG